MSDWHDEFSDRRDGVTIPTIWVAIALSLLIHGGVLWEWLPKLRLPSLDEKKIGEASGSLVVALLLHRAFRARASTAQHSERCQVPRRDRPWQQRPAARRRCSRSIAPRPTSRRPGRSVCERPSAGAAFCGWRFGIISRRAPGARIGTAARDGKQRIERAGGEGEHARANRIASANLGSQHAATFGYDPRKVAAFSDPAHGLESAEFVLCVEQKSAATRSS